MSWLAYLWIIPVLGVLVLVHEAGHFFTARLNGIRVEEFGFGFPPRIFGFKRKGVTYSINLLPVGGFVRIYGENGEHEDEPDAFGSKRWWQRAIVLAAGAGMNVVLAIVLFAVIAMTAGVATGGKGVEISQIEPNSPAAAANLKPGDRIVSVAGLKVGRNQDFQQASKAVIGTTRQHAGGEMSLVVERDGRLVAVHVVPRKNPKPGQGAIGAGLSPITVIQTRYDPIHALGVGVVQTWQTTGKLVTGIANLVTRQTQGGLAGPIGIAQLTGQVAEQAHIIGLMQWTALLSINLFLVNLLPLPALDGGRLVFVLLEAVRGRKVPPQREAVVHAVGMALLLMFLVVISVFDVQRIFTGGSLLPQ